MADGGRWLVLAARTTGFWVLWLCLPMVVPAEPPTAEDWASIRADLQAARTTGDAEQEAGAWLRLGQAQFESDDVSSAAQAFEQSARCYRRLGDLKSVTAALHEAASARLRLGDNESALRALQEALELHSSLDDPASEADVRNSYCLALQKLGRFH